MIKQRFAVDLQGTGSFPRLKFKKKKLILLHPLQLHIFKN